MTEYREIARLRSLQAFRILDTPPDEAFDRLTQLAAELFDAPMATVTLIDAERQWFKSRVGVSPAETSRDVAICAHAIELDPHAVMVIEDASRDGRFAANPLVAGEPNVRFYAGAVLTARDGQNLGTLCVLDDKPRPNLTAAEARRLRALARVVVDELELHRANQEAAEHRRIMALAEQVSGVGSWRLHIESGMITWTDEVYRIHGVTRETFDPALDDCLAFYAIEDQALVSDHIVNAIITGEGFTFDRPVRRRDGAVRDVICKAACETDHAGKVIALIGVFQDITEDKQQARALHAARAAAESAAATKAEFLANMSHELRTPLTSIVGFTGLMAAQPELSDVSRGFVDRVADASRALLTTVNDLLDFSKLEAGHVAIAPEATDPARVCRMALDLFTPQADEKELALTLVSDLADGLRVDVDPDRLRQVLLNLLSNAVKFSPSGEVRLQVGHADARLRIEVADTGPGLTAAQQARLFQRFAEVDAALARSAGGTGLGLAICKGLVEAMGGEIGATSARGQGSRFWFEIPAPIATEPQMAPLIVGSGVAPTPGLRLLVVDDHPANRELARLFLADAGVEVTEADGGVAGVEAAQLQPFDVILMDLNMPVMGGRQACRTIRDGDGPNRTTPILAFSAASDRDIDRRELDAAGFQGLVSKPVDPADLIAAVIGATACEPQPVASSLRRLG